MDVKRLRQIDAALEATMIISCNHPNTFFWREKGRCCLQGPLRNTTSLQIRNVFFFFLLLFFSPSVPLQQPNLSVTSPSGGLFWSPEGAEVTRGHSFLLTCSIAPQYPGGFFSLLFSGSRLNVLRRAVNHSASFSFPAAGPEQQGNYSCLYEVTLSSRTFTSTQEAPITVIITCKRKLNAKGEVVLRYYRRVADMSMAQKRIALVFVHHTPSEALDGNLL